ncbi:hypothetical protein SASPL_116847 [Salvia splendens]|uniref:3-ketoacyl-CoA synthase n=1 Tax=Salvia splendens TaxID=180675 RepID=A0A8X8XUG6_SALSN|nr:hypothetical protein SASPL_116847 [Salvia splendens]
MESIDMNEERLLAEVDFKDSSVVIKIRRKLPDFLHSVKLKYVKLGYHAYSCSLASAVLLILAAVAVSSLLLAKTTLLDTATILLAAAALAFPLGIYWTRRPRPQDRSSLFAGGRDIFTQGITSRPPNLSMAEARQEAESVMYGGLDALFNSTAIDPSAVGILIVNCSLFNPTPSLSSMIINHYKMRKDIKSFNLRGMGCSAGLISIDLAKHLLRANPDTYAIVVSTENITLNCYFGNDPSMLLCSCIFRMGGAAMLLSNKSRDRRRSKYELVHTVRTHKVGVSLARELMAVAGDALKTNITTLVLPLSEQLAFLVRLVKRKVAGARERPYIPDIKKAFEHVCIHAGGRAVLDAVEKNLQLTEWHMEPSRMTLHRFGNTSSSSLWYELAYTRVSRGNRVWQIAFGSGFKCNSAVWRKSHPKNAPLIHGSIVSITTLSTFHLPLNH